MGGIAVKKPVYSKEEEEARQKELRKARFTEDERYRCLENLTETSQELSLIHSGMERCYPLHIWQGVRAEYIIHFVIRGKGVYTVGGRAYALEGGQMFLIRPDTKIVYIADEIDPWEYAWIGIRGERVPHLLAACGFHSGIDAADFTRGLMCWTHRTCSRFSVTFRKFSICMNSRKRTHCSVNPACCGSSAA